MKIKLYDDIVSALTDKLLKLCISSQHQSRPLLTTIRNKQLFPYGYCKEARSSNLQIPMDIMNLIAKYPNYLLNWHIKDVLMKTFKEAEVVHKMYGPIMEFDGFGF